MQTQRTTYYEDNSSFRDIWGKKITLSSSLLAVIVLWYHLLKPIISWKANDWHHISFYGAVRNKHLANLFPNGPIF